LEQLSELTEIDMSNIWFIEKGQRNVHILTLKSIADVLKADVKDFI
jgi:transcriptional regulator with XRE-family HTH domain